MYSNSQTDNRRAYNVNFDSNFEQEPLLPVADYTNRNNTSGGMYHVSDSRERTFLPQYMLQSGCGDNKDINNLGSYRPVPTCNSQL